MCFRAAQPMHTYIHIHITDILFDNIYCVKPSNLDLSIEEFSSTVTGKKKKNGNPNQHPETFYSQASVYQRMFYARDQTI